MTCSRLEFWGSMKGEMADTMEKADPGCIDCVVAFDQC